MIELIDIQKRFVNGGTEHHAVDGVSLTIESGDIFGIIGASGAGKSTLVRCINLLEQPEAGQVIIDGQDITSLKGKELRELRSHIGMIFQNFSLFQQRSVLDNVLFPTKLAAGGKTARPEAEKHARELLALVGLEEKADSYPDQLSGGQKQRVAIARALMTKPSILLCDEATSALDTLTTSSVLELLEKINRELGVTIVLITHSLAVARKICNRVAVMDAGKVVEEGSTKDVLGNPQSDITKALVGFEGGVA